MKRQSSRLWAPARVRRALRAKRVWRHRPEAAGDQSDAIARSLGISPRTVEVHKARVLQKLRVHNLAQLIRLSLGAGWQV